MKRYMIERPIPGLGKASVKQVREAASASNAALAALAPDIQWLESFVTQDTTYCIYLAKDEETIRKHGEMSGAPLGKISEIHRVLDPLAGHKALSG